MGEVASYAASIRTLSIQQRITEAVKGYYRLLIKEWKLPEWDLLIFGLYVLGFIAAVVYRKYRITSYNVCYTKLLRIAFLGDSITAGVNGATPYPYLVKELLGVKEVYNLGQGGSTIATIDGSAAMTERCNDIPADADIIVVMGRNNFV